MKKTTLLLLAAVTLTIILSGCFLFGRVSITERLDMFKEDMENSPENLWEHIHPDNAKKSQLKDTTTWGAFDFENNTYSFSNVSGTGDTRTATLSETGSSSPYDGETLTFTMEEDGPGVWYIMYLDLSGFDDRIF